MKTSLLKRLDRLLYPVFCSGAVLLPKLSMPEANSILILRPGGLGDLICADMALEELGLDARRVTWLLELRSRPWAEHRGLTAFYYDQAPARVLSRLARRFSCVINTEQFFGLAQAYAQLAVGKGGRLFSFATNRGAKWADQIIPYDWREEHETVAFRRLFQAAFPEAKSGTYLPVIRPRREPASTPPFVMIAGRQSPSRNLSRESWQELLQSWLPTGSFLLGAAAADAEFADDLATLFSGRAERFTGSFSAICTQISRSEKLLTVDSGAVHIASYLGVPTTAVFTSGRDQKWRPLAANSHVVRRTDLPCQPCTKYGQVPACQFSYACKKIPLAF